MSIKRRTVLAAGGGVLGAAGLALAGCRASGGGSEAAAPSASSSAADGTTCVLTSELTEGPYYLDGARIRADITEGKGGVPLILRVTVLDATGCAMVADAAAVEIWHCDAWGYSSGFTGNSPGGDVPAEDGVGDDKTYLRGIQITGDTGEVVFTTIMPGWYSGRATHIHVKVHLGGTVDGDQYEGGTTVHTGQFFFADDVVASLDEVDPYSRHTGSHVWLDDDSIYQGRGVQDGLLAITANSAKPAEGYTATITVGIDPDAESTGGGAPG
ncbi:MAG TPA: intradiol ring-cleavage dioxygenase, partial [Phytomonospora sp.]